MKNILTLLALLISVSGIGVSLAREEVRCLIGLDSRCQSRRLSPKQIEPARKVVNTQAQPSQESAPDSQPDKAIKQLAPQPSAPVKKELPVEEATEPVGTKEIDKSNTLEAIPEPPSQPLEVIPAEEAGQAIEVIPPPEN
jgi:hypothetical protein